MNVKANAEELTKKVETVGQELTEKVDSISEELNEKVVTIAEKLQRLTELVEAGGRHSSSSKATHAAGTSGRSSLSIIYWVPTLETVDALAFHTWKWRTITLWRLAIDHLRMKEYAKGSNPNASNESTASYNEHLDRSLALLVFNTLGPALRTEVLKTLSADDQWRGSSLVQAVAAFFRKSGHSESMSRDPSPGQLSPRRSCTPFWTQAPPTPPEFHPACRDQATKTVIKGFADDRVFGANTESHAKQPYIPSAEAALQQ
ncbi:hypothetical protein V8E36_005248 [Tilletia maclaganii]